MLLVATGRQPNVGDLGLENAGVKFSRQGIQVNDHLQTNKRHIYAAGDCTGGLQATHYAGWQGFQAARNALLPGQSRGVSQTVPLAIYTDPEVAQVGLMVDQAREVFGDDVCVALRPLSQIDRALTDNQTAGFVKIVHKKDGLLLGATIIAPHAGEMIVEFVHGLRHKWKLRDIAETFHPYPTYAIGIQRLAADVATAQFLNSTTARLVQRLRGFV
jgi:pyruvate/2-oxoglutarate dehydrogenase complex dihydrolipoamide dehydrogenase (E3) component